MVIAGVSSPSSAPPSVTRGGAGTAAGRVDAASAAAKPPDFGGEVDKAAPVNPVSPVAHGNLSPNTLRDVILTAQDNAVTDAGQRSDAPTQVRDPGTSEGPPVEGTDGAKDGTGPARGAEAERPSDDRTPEQDPAGSLPSAMAARASDRGRAFAAERVDIAA